jgi:MATE family multidrug resistance protein
VVALAHAPLCYVFIYVLGMSYQGAAVAVSINGLLLLLLVLGYVWWYKVLEETHFQLSSRCFSNWWPFFKIALPNLLMMSEWYVASTSVTCCAGVD